MYKNKKIIMSLYALIFLVSVYLRFFNITNTVIFDWDEGWYYREAKGIYNFLLWAVHNAGSVMRDGMPDFGDLKEAIAGSQLYGLKYLHNISMLAVAAFTGLRYWTGPFTSALYAAGVLLMIIKTGRKYFSNTAALTALAFFGFSFYSVWITRSGLAEAGLVFYLTVSFYYYIACAENRGRYKYAVLWIVFFLLAFMYNYRTVIFIPAFFLTELYVVFKEKKYHLKFAAVKWAVFSAAFALYLFIMELPYFILRSRGSFPVLSYVDGLYFKFFAGQEKTLSIFQSFFDRSYLIKFISIHGIIIFILAVSALFYFIVKIKKWNYKKISLLIFLIFNLLFAQVLATKEPYILLTVFLFGGLIIGVFIEDVINKMNNNYKSISFIVFLTLFSFLLLRFSYKIPFITSGYFSSARYLKENGIRKIITNSSVILSSYFDDKDIICTQQFDGIIAAAPHKDLLKMILELSKEYKYLVLIPGDYDYLNEKFPEDIKKLDPVAEFYLNEPEFMLYGGEPLYDFHAEKDVLNKADFKIKIFKLSDLTKAGEKNE